ncbi:acid resistance serine protease MarP [Alteromonas gracilis]
MNPVDLAIALAAAAFAVVGWRQGMVRTLWAFVGLLLGAGLGLAVVPRLLSPLVPTVWVALLAVTLLLGTAIGLRFAAVRLETRVRGVAPWQPDPHLDRPAGAVLGVIAVGMTSWLIGTALAGSTLPVAARAANDSATLTWLHDRRLPVSRTLLGAFDAIGQRAGFDHLVDPFTPEVIRPVPPPDPAVTTAPGVRRSAGSVVKLRANSDCGLGGLQGSAFAIAPDVLVTNAHVVAGSSDLHVDLGADRIDAVVVALDTERDLALVRAPGLGATPLTWTSGSAEEPVAIVGYPGDGERTVVSGRLRERRSLVGTDIYGQGAEERGVWTIRTVTRQGDSGGPVLDERGRVVGVLFGGSRADEQTSYALTTGTAAELRALVRTATEPVDVGPCDGVRR